MLLIENKLQFNVILLKEISIGKTGKRHNTHCSHFVRIIVCQQIMVVVVVGLLLKSMHNCIVIIGMHQAHRIFHIRSPYLLHFHQGRSNRERSEDQTSGNGSRLHHDLLRNQW